MNQAKIKLKKGQGLGLKNAPAERSPLPIAAQDFINSSMIITGLSTRIDFGSDSLVKIHCSNINTGETIHLWLNENFAERLYKDLQYLFSGTA